MDVNYDDLSFEEIAVLYKRYISEEKKKYSLSNQGLNSIINQIDIYKSKIENK